MKDFVQLFLVNLFQLDYFSSTVPLVATGVLYCKLDGYLLRVDPQDVRLVSSDGVAQEIRVTSCASNHKKWPT